MTYIPTGAVSSFVDATNKHDAHALLAVFAPLATVTDDGSTYTGSTAIQQWIQEHQITPKITLDPISYSETNTGTVLLTASADGEFPGGPLPFDFEFSLDGDQVTGLSIHLSNRRGPA